MPSWDQIWTFVHELGVVKGTFVLFFWVAHAAYFALQNGRLKDRQKEIDRLAGENKDYRDRFTALLDRELKIKPHELPPSHLPRKKK
jgi:hypothetical protein